MRSLLENIGLIGENGSLSRHGMSTLNVPIIILILLGACAVSGGELTKPPIHTVVASSPAFPAASIVSTETEEQSLAITGTVMQISLSARVILLEEPVDGYTSIALLERGQFISENGREILLQDIRPGSTIQAVGRSGGSNALLASEVIVLKR
jgi:hypothetical protein